MSLSSTGSVGGCRAAASSVRDAGGLPARPGVASRGERQRGTLAVRRRSALPRVRRRPCGGVAAATLRTGPDELESGDDARVGPLGGRGAMPRLAVGVSETGQGIGQRPVRRAPLLARWRPGRPPSARAGAAPSPTSASAMRSPEATAASRACSPTPSVDAARRTTASSPVSSAAASSSTDCTGGGSSRLRSRKACSTRVVRCSCAGSGEDPPSWSGLSSVGSSSSASGLPPLSAIEPFGDLRCRCVPQALVEQLAGSSRSRARSAAARRCRRGGTVSLRRRGPRTP